MRKIEYTKVFKRDWKRERAGVHRRHLEAHFPEIVSLGSHSELFG